MDFLSLPIDEVELVFFDVETTGLSVNEGHAICELGAVKIKGEEQVSVFSTLINPKRSIPISAGAVHHISDTDVKDAPYFEEIIDKFLYFLGEAVLGGYNIGFDLGFLNTELSRINYPLIEMPSIDVLLMARKFLSLRHYHLRALADYFNISMPVSHRALQDAIVTKEVFLKIKEEIKKRGIIQTKDFITLYGFDNNFFKKYEEPKIVLIQESIRAKLSLRICYVSFTQKRKTYLVIPQKIIEKNEKKYMLGVDLNTEKELVFNLKHILSVEVL